MFEIEKNIPLPDRAGNSKYPWLRMEVGDSFFVESPPKNFTGAVYRARYTRGLPTGAKFICREEGAGIRVWRVS